MASGFNNVPPASEFRRPTSWGRTRSPKNILSSHRSGINANGTPKTLGDEVSIVVDTENQRYLHVWVTADGGGLNKLKVHGNAYAAAAASQNDGVLDSFQDIPLTSTAGTDMSTVGQGEGYYLIEIGGIDKIKFEGVTGNVSFYAACSTFSMS